MTFTPETLSFLAELAENNRREWFEANRSRYEAHVREPALAFIRAMRPHLAELAPGFVAEDKKVGGSLMRIHRDTRFRQDKTPYKTNIGIQFRHEGGDDVHAPGVYLHVATDSTFLGIGCYLPPPDALEGLRQRLVADPDGFRAIVDEPAFASTFRREDHGEPLKRAPKGYDPAHSLIAELRRKSHLATASFEPAEVLGDGLVDRVAERLRIGRPWLAWLCEGVGTPFH